MLRDEHQEQEKTYGADKLANTAQECSTTVGDPQEYTLNRLKDRFRYHAPGTEQVRRYQNLRDAALAFATVIVRNAPDNPDRGEALKQLEATLMQANKSIALEYTPY